MGTVCYTASVTSSSEALGQRMAGSKCLGPCPMRYSALKITVTSLYLSTVRRGSKLRGHQKLRCRQLQKGSDHRVCPSS